MFIDATAIVAILLREPEAGVSADALDGAHSPITSPIAMFEAALGIGRERHASVAEAQADVVEFLPTAGVRTVSISGKEAETALDAFSRYGKGSGYPAPLTLGNCFAYSVARNYGISLLFKGDDFDKTDVRPAAAAPWCGGLGDCDDVFSGLLTLRYKSWAALSTPFHKYGDVFLRDS